MVVDIYSEDGEIIHTYEDLPDDLFEMHYSQKYEEFLIRLKNDESDGIFKEEKRCAYYGPRLC